MNTTRLGLWMSAAVLLAPIAMATHGLYFESSLGTATSTSTSQGQKYTDSWFAPTQTVWPGALPRYCGGTGTPAANEDTDACRTGGATSTPANPNDYAHKYVLTIPTGAVGVTVSADAFEDNDGTMGTTQSKVAILRISVFKHSDPDSLGNPKQEDRYSRCPSDVVTSASSMPPAGALAEKDSLVNNNAIIVVGVVSAPGAPSVHLGAGKWVVYVDGVIAAPNTWIKMTVLEDNLGQTPFGVEKLRERIEVFGLPIDGIPVGLDLGRCMLIDPVPGSASGLVVGDLLATSLPSP